MTKSNTRIEIVRSAIKGFSSMSKDSAMAVLAVLAKQYAQPRITSINSLSDLAELALRKPDLVFMGMECIPSDPELGLQDPNRIWIAQYLDEHGIAYTGSRQAAQELGRNKVLAKQCVLDAGLATARFLVVDKDRTPRADSTHMTYPMFIKPTDRGGGQGIDSMSVVYTPEQFRSKVDAISATLQTDSLVEEYLSGREFSVAVLRKADGLTYQGLPIELIAPPDNSGERILSKEVKSSNVERAVAIADSDLRSEIANFALQVFHALGGRDYGRIDIRLDTTGKPHFLEANLIPSLISGYGSFPKACMLNINLAYEDMILRITEMGLARRNNADNARQRPTRRHSIIPFASAGASGRASNF